MNSFKINYTSRRLKLNFNNEMFEFDLKKGDIGDFWGTFTTKKGVMKDINFYQENEREKPIINIYGLTKKNGHYFINMNDETYIRDFKLIGNPLSYFE